jgi:hypothetical protein
MDQEHYRLIIVSTENGEDETVVFTHDCDTPATDFCRPGQTVDYDDLIYAELPSAFPVDSPLRKEY